MTEEKVAEICEHHGEPLFTMSRGAKISSESSYVFCRHCAVTVKKIICPHCSNVMPVMSLHDETRVLADVTLRNLSCTRCKEVIASANVTGIGD